VSSIEEIVSLDWTNERIIARLAAAKSQKDIHAQACGD
jgi:hypothetical protein